MKSLKVYEMFLGETYFSTPQNDDDDNDGDDLFVCIVMCMSVTVYRVWMGNWIC
jgi:hypothetical protein